LAQAAAEAQTLRESQARQIRLDALRALADVAGYVHGAIGSQAPERITRRINSKIGQQGIIPIAEPGEQTAYRPKPASGSLMRLSVLPGIRTNLGAPPLSGTPGAYLS
jgi:hypothetical protein